MGSICSFINVCDAIPISNMSSMSVERPKLKLLLIGLDNAGKTSTVMHLLGRSMDEVVPTVGFSSVEMKQINKFRVEVYDLGGGPKIRSIWKNYFALVHGIIYVVDSTDEQRVPEVKANLEGVIQHDKISMKPILILINKQDMEGALEEEDIRKTVNIESLVNKYKCPTRIESCSASAVCDQSSKNDSGIHNGYSWIISYIIKNWNELNERVQKEEKEQIETERQVMKERYRRYHEKNDSPTVQDVNGDANQEVLTISEEPCTVVEEVITKLEVETQEKIDTEHNDSSKSANSTNTSSSQKKKRKSVFKSNKVTPLIQTDER